MKNNKNAGPIKKVKIPGSNPGRGRAHVDAGSTASGGLNPPAPSTYDWLLQKFARIDRVLKPEMQTELDGIISDLSKTLDAAFEQNQKDFYSLVTVTRDQCAAAICPLCLDGTPRTEFNGREVHDSKGTSVRCAANPIWSLGAKIRGLRPTPYGIFVDKMFNLPKVSPVNGNQPSTT